MGTATAVGTELVLKSVVEILGPSGTYEKRRIALRHEYGAVVVASQKLTVIETAEQAEEATKFGRLLQTAAKETETFFKGVKLQIDDIKKPVLQAEKDDSGPYNTEKARLGGLLTAYQAAERRKREEEERLAREAAEKQAQEDALQRAIDLAAAGEDEAADAVLDEPIVAAPVIIPASAPKPTGSVARKNYDIEITDLKALVAAVAAGTMPLLCLVPNESFIRNQAKAMKEAFSMPGVKLVVTESTSFRS
jgi:hypothetical protein